MLIQTLKNMYFGAQIDFFSRRGRGHFWDVLGNVWKIPQNSPTTPPKVRKFPNYSSKSPEMPKIAEKMLDVFLGRRFPRASRHCLGRRPISTRQGQPSSSTDFDRRFLTLLIGVSRPTTHPWTHKERYTHGGGQSVARIGAMQRARVGNARCARNLEVDSRPP